jgi:hypothetical protein
VGFVWASVWSCWPNTQSRWTSALASSHRWSACAPPDNTVLAAGPDGPPPSRELRSLQRSGCSPCDPFWVALFGGRGPFPWQLCPCGADRPLWSKCHWHCWRCHRCGGDRGGWDYRGRRHACLACCGDRGGDDGSSDARGCHDRAGWGYDALRSLTSLGSFEALCPLSPSSSDSSLSWWVRGAMGQRPTFAGGGPVTYCLLFARKPATQSVPYSQTVTLDENRCSSARLVRKPRLAV